MFKIPVRYHAVLLPLLALPLLAWAADPKTEHEAMKKEHAKAHADHDQLLGQVAKWKIEHRRALSTLALIESKILEHEASLEELAEHAREHEDHIVHHDEEIHDHEKSGNDRDHAKLAETHKKLIAEHAKLMKSASTFEDDHESLMESLRKIGEGLNKKK
jgi:chromosome segregation ATPase